MSLGCDRPETARGHCPCCPAAEMGSFMEAARVKGLSKQLVPPPIKGGHIGVCSGVEKQWQLLQVCRLCVCVFWQFVRAFQMVERNQTRHEL